MHGVVQQRDAAAEDAAENFCDDEPESGDHGPAQNCGAQRGVHVAGVTVTSVTVVPVIMTMIMRMAGVTVIVAVGMGVHLHHSTHSRGALQPCYLLIGQFDTPPPGMD